MKNLEAIDEIVERFEYSAEFERTHGNLMGCQEFKQLAEWLKELKAYKEQEPCEDTISREATIKYLNTNMAWYDEDGEIADSEEKTKAITDLVNGVPPCAPKQKTGKWIYDENGMDWNLAAWRCSECHVRNMNIPPNMIFGKNEVRKIANPLMFQGSKFCPNCGAKMEGED